MHSMSYFSAVFYMDLTAKLTGQLDFDPGGHAGVYVGQAARHTCWYRLSWTSNSRICEASFSPRLCHISTPWPSAQPLRTVVSRSCLDARRRSKFSSSNALRRGSGRLDTRCQSFFATQVASEAICKWEGSQCRIFLDVPPLFSYAPHMRGLNDCLLPTERQY